MSTSIAHLVRFVGSREHDLHGVVIVRVNRLHRILLGVWKNKMNAILQRIDGDGQQNLMLYYQLMCKK